MGNNDDHIIRFARGRGTNFGKAKNHALRWPDFKNLFRDPPRSNEKLREYGKLSVEEQNKLKSINGWIYRTQIEGEKRNAKSGLPSDLISLDFDYATPEFVKALIGGLVLAEIEFFAHSSRRSTPERPRLRLFIPLARPVDNDTYGALSRIVTRMIDPQMDMIDPVSFRKAQMMFLPTCSKDSDYLFIEGHGDLMEWEDILDTFEMVEGDWRDVSKLPKATTESELREVAEKAEKPDEKDGPVGDFCRAYDVMEAIEAFDLPYEPVDMDTGKPRYTYTGGTTVNGAEVQDDGDFLYSHHGSDPASDQLLNAFDLVMIHKFGHLDDPNDKDTPMGKRKSWKAMLDLISKDERYKRSVVESRYDADAMNADFDAAMEDEDIAVDHDYTQQPKTPDKARHDDEQEHAEDYSDDFDAAMADEEIEIDTDHKPKSKADPKKRVIDPNWRTQLELTKDGDIRPTPANIALVVANDARLGDAIGYNDFTKETVLRRRFVTKAPFLSAFHVSDPVNGDLWDDAMEDTIRIMLSIENGRGKVGWGLNATEQNVRAAVGAAARMNTFHPVRDYFDSLEHDGAGRVRQLFQDYMGSPDNAYYREVAMAFLVGCVTRIYEPGAKMDLVPILHGAQGKRKSTFIAKLACGWFGELTAKFSEDTRLIEQMKGCLLMEMPELSGITRSIIEDAKAFVSARQTQVRTAYGRRPQVFKRQCCFMGSTNEDQFLIDTTGNRRWLPIEVLTDMIDTDKLEANVDQLWAEAVAIYKQMRIDQPTGDLFLDLVSDEAREIAKKFQNDARRSDDMDMYAEPILAYLNTPEVKDENFGPNETAFRDKVTVHEIWVDALDQDGRKANPQESLLIGRVLKSLGWASGQGMSRKGPKDAETGQRPSFKIFIPDDEAKQAQIDWWEAESARRSPKSTVEADYPDPDTGGDFTEDDDLNNLV